MSTYWAHAWCFFAIVYVTAVCAVPSLFFVFFKYFAFFYVSKKFKGSFFVVFFNFANSFKEPSNFCKAFFFCFFSHYAVHFCMFVVFACSSIFKVFDCAWNFAVVKKFEPEFCVFFFVVSCFKEKVSNLVVAFFFCFGSILCVFVSCLAFACECSHKVSFCFCAFQVHSYTPLVIIFRTKSCLLSQLYNKFVKI